MDRLAALISQLRSLLDEIVRGVVLLRQNLDAQEASGLRGDILKALPKFQRRPKYQRRRHLVSVLKSVYSGLPTKPTLWFLQTLTLTLGRERGGSS